MAIWQQLKFGLTIGAMVVTAGAAQADTRKPARIVIVPLPVETIHVDPSTPSPNRRDARIIAGDALRRGVVVPAIGTTLSRSTPPPGFREAWNDDRMNPYRGPRTLKGDFQTQGIWTTTVPRRLRPVIYVAR